MPSIVRKTNNTYKVTVSAGYDINGKKIRKYKTILVDDSLTAKRAEKEAQRLAYEFEHEVLTGNYLDGNKINFADFVARWRVDYAEKHLQPKTIEKYEGLLKRILPAIGHIKLNMLQPTHLIKFYSKLESEGMRNDNYFIAKPELKKYIKSIHLTHKAVSGLTGIKEKTVSSIINEKSTKFSFEICKGLDIEHKRYFIAKEGKSTLSGRVILHHHLIISSILSSAVHWQLIESNPASRVKPPKAAPPKISHFDEDTIHRVLSLLEEEPIKYKTMIYITIFSGCRVGELCGLEWSHINFEEGLIEIRQSSQYVSGKGTITKAPKNVSSERIIALPPMVIPVLKQYKKWQNEEKLKLGELWEENNRLFTQCNGKPIYPATPSQWFVKFRRKHNLPDVTFHGLRHSNASLLISQGVDIQTIATRLGHTKATTTTTVYSHFLQKPDRIASEKLENLFSKANSNS